MTLLPVLPGLFWHSSTRVCTSDFLRTSSKSPDSRQAIFPCSRSWNLKWVQMTKQRRTAARIWHTPEIIKGSAIPRSNIALPPEYPRVLIVNMKIVEMEMNLRAIRGAGTSLLKPGIWADVRMALASSQTKMTTAHPAGWCRNGKRAIAAVHAFPKMTLPNIGKSMSEIKQKTGITASWGKTIVRAACEGLKPQTSFTYLVPHKMMTPKLIPAVSESIR